MLIGLHGPAQSGKDTIYQIIEDLHWDDARAVERRAFADPLKISAARALGFEGHRVECVDFCNDLKVAGTVTIQWDNEVLVDSDDTVTSHWMGWSISGREFLQYYGTEAHRDVFGTDFWVDATLPEGERYDKLTVVTDVRFPNEAIRVRQNGGLVWRVERPIEGIAESAHASETPLSTSLLDYLIVNDGDLDHLKEQVVQALEFSRGVYYVNGGRK